MNLNDYRSFLDKDVNNALFRATLALSFLKSPALPDSLLDIGCGSGELLRLAKEQGITQIFGVDGVEDAVESCRDINGIIRRVDLNNEKLPFPDNFVEGVTCLEVLEHLYAPQVIISELFRVLQPGRWAVISVPNPFHILMRLRILFGANVSDPEIIGGHIKFFRAVDIRKMCTACGFDETHLEGTPSPGSIARYGGLTAGLGRSMPDLFATWIFVYCHKPLESYS